MIDSRTPTQSDPSAGYSETALESLHLDTESAASNEQAYRRLDLGESGDFAQSKNPEKDFDRFRVIETLISEPPLPALSGEVDSNELPGRVCHFVVICDATPC